MILKLLVHLYYFEMTPFRTNKLIVKKDWNNKMKMME